MTENRFFVLLLCWLAGTLLFAGESYRLSHGPYLQGLSPTGVTVVFETSDRGFSWVEVMKPGNAPVKYYRTQNGLREAGNLFNSIRLTGLKPGTRYLYRICSKQITGFDPYAVAFGDSAVSVWIPFRTPDPKEKRHSFLVMSDIHGDTVRLRKLLNRGDYNSCDAIIFVGDMVDYVDAPDALYRGFIDRCTAMFASRIPFIAVRGNHETRGAYARLYPLFISNETGLIYGAYRWGDVALVLLDPGEDKPDNRRVYAGLTDFDAYRTEQAAWLKGIVEGDLYREARYRIVFSHYATIRPTLCDRWQGLSCSGAADLTGKTLGLLNRASVNLMISGHTHRFAWYPAGSWGNGFPVVVSSNRSAVRLDIGDGVVRVRVYDDEGRTLLLKTIETE